MKPEFKHATDEAIAEALNNAYPESPLGKKPVQYLEPKPKRPVNRTLGDCRAELAGGCYVKVKLRGAP